MTWRALDEAGLTQARAVCGARCEAPYDAALCARLLGPLLRSPGCALAWGDAALAALIDTCASAEGVAALEVLWGAGALDDAALTALVRAAQEAAAAGPARFIELILDPARPAPLEAAGMWHAWTSYTMERAAGPPAPPSALPEGWRWGDLEDAQIAAYHAVVAAAFAAVPGSQVPSLGELARAVRASARRPRVLWDGAGHLVGYVNVEGDVQRAHVRSLGRAPSHRGQGVGAYLMDEALRCAGERAAWLEVAAPNAAALRRYEESGFVVTSALPVYRCAAM